MKAASAVRRIAIIAFIGGLGGGLVFPILPALGLCLGIPGFMVGLILSANRISRLIFNLPAGLVINRWGPRLTLSTALLIETLGVLGFSVALHVGGTMWWLLAGRIIYGIGTAFLMVGALAAVLSLSDREDRGRKTAVVRVATSISVPAGLVLGGVLADAFSDDVAFLTGAAITLAGAVFSMVLLPSMPERSQSTVSGERSSLGALLISSSLPFLVAAWGFNLLIFFTVQGTLLSTLVLLVQHRHIQCLAMRAQGTSGLIMALLIGCSGPAAIGIGRILDASPLRSVLLLPALAGLAGGFAVLAVAQSLWVAFAGAALVGLSFNGVTLPMLTLLGDSVSNNQCGIAVGVYRFFGDIGGTIGPILGIEVAAHIGLTPLYLALAALLALSIPIAVWIRNCERRQQGSTGKTIPTGS